MSDLLTQLYQANMARDHEMTNGKQVFSLSFRGNELAGETGEVCNILKKLDREKLGIVGSKATIAQLEDELADVIICISLIAMDLDIDLEPCIRRKFNKTSDERGLQTKL